MNQKILLLSIAAASAVLTFSYVVINRNFSDDQQASVPNSGMTESWKPRPQSAFAVAESKPEQPAQLSEDDSHDESVVHLNDSSVPPAMINQELLSSLSDEMKAQYIQALEADWQRQVEAGRKVREMEQGGGFEKPPEEQARMFSIAAALVPGADVDADAANIAWQAAEDEFALPDDEQFYGAEVDAACADDICKLQFQGFDGEESRDSAIDKLITDKKIPQDAMIMPDEANPGRFVVIYPKKQS
jgi:hypothetical protein